MNIAIIGSMRDENRHLLERARAEYCHDGDICITPVDDVSPTDMHPAHVGRLRANPLVNTCPGHWHTVVDWAAMVVVVTKPDGSLGAGTVAELRHAVGRGKTIRWSGV